MVDSCVFEAGQVLSDLSTCPLVSQLRNQTSPPFSDALSILQHWGRVRKRRPIPDGESDIFSNFQHGGMVLCMAASDWPDRTRDLSFLDGHVALQYRGRDHKHGGEVSTKRYA